MAHDEILEQRVRSLLSDRSDLQIKRMFGGVGFMLQGNMACGVHSDYLIVRVGPERYEEALALPQTRVFDLSGRPMTGWITVAAKHLNSDEDLSAWLQQGVDFALTLPPK